MIRLDCKRRDPGEFQAKLMAEMSVEELDDAISSVVRATHAFTKSRISCLMLLYIHIYLYIHICIYMYRSMH